MADIVSKQKRSVVMAAVRSQANRTTELRLITLFRRWRISGWRRKQKLIGKPDFVFRHKRVVVFVDGCFWHGCPSCYRRPSSHRAYWDTKVRTNKARDRLVTQRLHSSGWRVLRIWEHELRPRNEARLARRLERLR
ncbi:MAG: DNA mismatch endonuclease Vsr [Verrucomicrobia bacterium]|nr:DNA mismatch endonuclease Vsr [Verrucomicrobiota bacterium]